MGKLSFFIVDVFAEKKYTGNQLAVVTGAEDLTGEEMQQVAREMNYSETTFVLSGARKGGGYDVRIFTPAEEVPFAGHPTLGTAYIIQRKLIKEPVEEIILNLKCGQIPVRFSNSKGEGFLWMNQLPPVPGPVHNAAEVAAVLGIDEEQVDTRFPVQEVSTGLPFIIVPLRTLDAVRGVKINRDKYLQLVKGTEAKCILVFCPETYNPEYDLNARVFCDYYGVPEDPATGSANGCLAGYLAAHRYRGTGSISVQVEQGYEIGRPSLLLLEANDNGGEIDINIGGKVFMVAEGMLV